MRYEHQESSDYQYEPGEGVGAGVEEVLERIKSELADEVKEDDTSVSRANLEWLLASNSGLVKAVAEHEVSVAYGM